MRNITEQTAQALFNLKDFNKSNTRVDTMGHVAKMFLHGHRIAYYDAQKNILSINNQGFFTQTTKERLNGLKGVNIKQKGGKWYLNGQEWDGTEKEVVL